METNTILKTGINNSLIRSFTSPMLLLCHLTLDKLQDDFQLQHQWLVTPYGLSPFASERLDKVVAQSWKKCAADQLCAVNRSGSSRSHCTAERKRCVWIRAVDRLSDGALDDHILCSQKQRHTCKTFSSEMTNDSNCVRGTTHQVTPQVFALKSYNVCLKVMNGYCFKV